MTPDGTARVPLDRLKPAPWNPRLIRDERFQQLCRSLEADPDFFEQRPILATADGTIYAGNMRYRAAAHLGWETVPAIITDIPDQLAKERALRDNNQFGEWSEQELAELLVGLKLEGSDLALLGFDDKRLEELLDSVGALGEGNIPEDPGAEIDRADELREKWQTEHGQLWLIENHRLLCGDSTNAADVARLMGGARADIVFADPPYGISIVAANGFVGGGEAYDIPFGGRKGTKRLGSVGGAKPFGSADIRGSDGASNVVSVGKYAPIKGDDTTDTALSAYRLLSELYPGAVHIWWGGNYYANALPPSSCWLVWDKENTGNFADCELAWTNQESAVRIFRHQWNGMLRDSERERRIHPTQKPAALAVWAFEKYGRPGQRVLDPFIGGGMSMVAAEQTGLVGYGIEFEPAYIATTLERLAQMGLEPKLAD